jgi:hypothetical protein
MVIVPLTGKVESARRIREIKKEGEKEDLIAMVEVKLGKN